MEGVEAGVGHEFVGKMLDVFKGADVDASVIWSGRCRRSWSKSRNWTLCRG